jgi:2-oxoglutarate dehydrogenase E1 component
MSGSCWLLCTGIVGVRFKRLIMDDTGLMPKSRAPRPPKEESFK